MSTYNETTKFCTSDDILENNWYEILGCNVNSSQAEIDQAYRALAKQYHPDKNKERGAINMFYQINSAYQILSDREIRAFYDYESGNIDTEKNSFRFHTPDDIIEFKFYIDDLTDNIISSKTFGDGIWDAIKFKYIGDNKSEFNRKLNIFGILDVSKKDLSKDIRTAFPLYRFKTCGVCRGFGKIGIEEREICYNCDGYGMEEERIFVYVEIPKNYKASKLFKVAGRGHKVPAGIGDLILQINPVGRISMKTKLFQSTYRNKRFKGDLNE